MNDTTTTPPTANKRSRPYYGKSVYKGMIRYTSVSQIKTFDPKVDGGCNRKWAYPYLFNKKLAKTGAQTAGSEYADNLEHYLTTGEDILPPVLQPAKKYLPAPGRDLECERPLSYDLKHAIELRDEYLKSAHPPTAEAFGALLKKYAGLVAFNIPLDGAADVRHNRGEYVDINGVLQREPAGAIVVETGDLKTVSRIYPHTIRKGPNAGTILRSYVKTDAEVCADTQMIGYARYCVDAYPEMTHARLSHIYANTQKREGAKRTGLISVEQILRRWDLVENTVRKMTEVATAERIEDIEPNVSACDSYTHVDPMDPSKVLKGCGHRYYCPLSISQTVTTMLGPYKESAMSLCDSPSGTLPVAPAAPTPPTPPLDDAAHAAAVQAAKARFLAEDDEDAPAALGFCSRCGTALTGANASKLQTGEVKHIGCGAAAMTATVAPQPPAPPIAVNPPDQPRAPSMLDAAAPVPTHEIAQITDPALKAEVEQHARDHAARAAAEAARLEAEKVAAGTSTWCPGSTQRVVITTAMAVAGGYDCQCGKHYSMKLLKPLKEGDSHVSVIPKHKPPKTAATEAVAAPAVPSVPTQAAFAPPLAPTVPVPPAPTAPVPPAPVVAPAPPVEMVTNTAQNGHTKDLRCHVDRRIVFRVKMMEGKEIFVLASNFKEVIALVERYKIQSIGFTSYGEVIAVEALADHIIEAA